MEYTVKQLAQLSGISVRTLHYYDEIGLLHPASIRENGYRVYGEKEVSKLQQILFFRELEFSLEDIAMMVNSPNFNRLDAFKDQKKLLELKKERITKLLESINRTIEGEKGGEIMKNDDLFASFKDDKLVEHMEEAKQRWGNTDAYKQSMEKVKNWTKEDYERVKAEGKRLTEELAKGMDLPVESEQAQALVEKHYQGINYFYDCSYEMYHNLGQMYVSDPRFTAYYESFRPGLAMWLRDAIEYYIKVHSA